MNRVSTSADGLTLYTAGGVARISAQDWDRCAGSENPFVRHAFFACLEESGSADPETGWAPVHLCCDLHGELVGIMPLYLKSHSFGEYVFDQNWAQAYRQAGGDYYPKLQAAIPFTPVTGPRLLVDASSDGAQVRKYLLMGAIELACQLDLSSLHITFLNEPDLRACRAIGLLQRTDRQFHWHNRGYSRFDDFLADLSSKRRKIIRQERRAVTAADIAIEPLNGADIRESHWDSFWRFYQDTSDRKWGQAYLTRRFFSMLGEHLADRILLLLARRHGRYVAGALHLMGDDALFGRYWVCVEYHPCLHFELCYYQAIDFAIARGLLRVEAGAQGEHKLARGYLPIPTYSAHWIADPKFRAAIEHYLRTEGRFVGENAALLAAHSPFRQGSA
jgi:hypothetical protein